MFVDNVEIQVRAGHGGSGLASFRREKFLPFGGPDGGDGGRGGDIYLAVDSGLNSLASFKHKSLFKAGNGGAGGKNRMHGTNAADLVIKAPVGTAAYVKEKGCELIVADLQKDGQKVLLARGGRGGKGNVHYATATRKAPTIFQPGEEGQQCDIILKMQLVIDVCIIGFTNSGKSALLSELSSARPEVADYQFTTKVPVLGVVDDGGNKMTWAELPALVKGSGRGKGLGNRFLHHAGRALVIVYLLDAGSADLKADFEELRNEIKGFDAVLAQKAAIIAVNKSDVVDDAGGCDYIKERLLDTGLPRVMVSALERQGLDELILEVHGLAVEARNMASSYTKPEVVFRPKPVDRRDA
ncbi:MAG: GTPase ObgE [Chloroflexi bacterium]|nr:GTPase ObgE [Chloroflexota bacterium]